MDSDIFVQTRDLTKVYASGKIRVVALNAVNLSVKKGQFLGVTGPSGSGKSTLVNLIGGLDTPTSGTIKVNGKIISELNSEQLALYRRYQVGMIFQSFNLISSYTALENVAFPLLFAGIGKKERHHKAQQILSMVGLNSRKDHRPSELSGGQQQRVAIARALINEPKILLADEPTGNLDSKTAEQIIEVLSDLNRNRCLTVVIISHEQSLLCKYANNIIHLHDGKILEQIQLR